MLRRESGLEVAQLALGHASAQVTDAVYAERDRAKVMDVMRKIG
jgi:integrase